MKKSSEIWKKKNFIGKYSWNGSIYLKIVGHRGNFQISQELKMFLQEYPFENQKNYKLELLETDQIEVGSCCRCKYNWKLIFPRLVL